MTTARYTRRRKSLVPYEAEEMRMLSQWLDLAGVLWAHVPNEQRHRRHGTKRGVPDVLVFSPPPKDMPARGVAIELKRSSGGVVSDEQEQWLGALRACDWIAFVADGARAAITRLEGLGYSLNPNVRVKLEQLGGGQ